jgi:hypothetical protein
MNWIIYTMLALAIFILMALTMVHRRRNWINAEKSLDKTLAACRSLLALVGNFQQHRGMSSALLSGDQGFKARLDAKGYEIERLIPSLREVARDESLRAHPCLTLNDLALFQFNWGQLREKLVGLSVEQSIAQHSFLIDQLLHWLAALGESRVELLLADSGARGLVRNYASRLPALTECLGQARALGTSVAARRGCSAVARGSADVSGGSCRGAAQSGQRSGRAGPKGGKGSARRPGNGAGDSHPDVAEFGHQRRRPAVFRGRHGSGR